MSILRSTVTINTATTMAGSLVAFCLASLIGLGLGLGFYILAIPLALFVPAILLLNRPDIYLLAYTGLTLLIAGTLKYYWGLGQFQWLLSAIGVALLCYSLVRGLFSKTRPRVSADGFTQAMLLWWVLLVFSSTVNFVPALDWFVGLRQYLPAFGVFAYLSYCRPPVKLLRRVVQVMLCIASVQWIFALHQKLYVVPLRLAGHYKGSHWDSIVGSFGGNRFGGGESGSLGVYLTIAFLLSVALKKHGQIKTLWFFGVMLTGLAALALTEVKVIALILPLGIFIIYKDYLIKSPLKFLTGAAVVVALLVGLFSVYHYIYWQDNTRLNFSESVYSKLFYSFDPHFNPTAINLGRVGSLIFWWSKHSFLYNPITLLFGHGLASAVSASAVIGEGSAVHLYGITLDVTGTSKLLWESGIIGLIAFLSIFFWGFLRSRSLKNHPSLPAWHRAAMVGVESAMLLMPLSIFYEVTVVSSPPMQFVAMFLLGYVAYWWRETGGAVRA